MESKADPEECILQYANNMVAKWMRWIELIILTATEHTILEQNNKWSFLVHYFFFINECTIACWIMYIMPITTN